MERLTRTQREVLEHLERGDRLMVLTGRETSAFLANAGRVRLPTLWALERRGLIKRSNDRVSGFDFILTAMGRNAL